MACTHRVSMGRVVVFCLVGMLSSGTVFAHDADSALAPPAGDVTPPVPVVERAVSSFTFPAPGPFAFAPAFASAGQVYQGRPYRLRHDGSVAALMIGAVATITGAAILVYANRPDCSGDRYGTGCGYGTKVVGGAVLSGGIAGLFVGALTWR